MCGWYEQLQNIESIVEHRQYYSMRAVPHLNGQKLEAIERAKSEGVSTELAKHFKVNRTTLYRWVKNESTIRAAAPSKTYSKVTKRGPPVRFQAMEKRLYEWVTAMRRNKSKCVTTECLMILAGRFEPQFIKGRTTAAAVEYLRRFRRRHKLYIRRITHRGTKQRSDLEEVAALFGHSMRYAFEYNNAVSYINGGEKYTQINNMDQSSIYIDMNPTTTITFSGNRNVDVLQGMSENSFRASIFLCASASGAKLCPLIVFNGTPDGIIEEELHAHPLYSKNVFLAVQKKDYCDERVMHIWIDQVWRPSVSSPKVLLLDSLKTHKMSSVRSKLEDNFSTEVEFIPPGITGLSQPMDVAVMRTFKMNCRSLYVKHHLTNDFCSSATERRRLIIAIVVTAWAQIKENVIRKGFVKAGLIPIGPRERDGTFHIVPPTECERSEGENNDEVEADI